MLIIYIIRKKERKKERGKERKEEQASKAKPKKKTKKYEHTINQMLHALLSIIQCIQERAPHHDRPSPQAERFEDVGSATDAAVDIHFDLVEDVRGVFMKFE